MQEHFSMAKDGKKAKNPGVEFSVRQKNLFAQNPVPHLQNLQRPSGAVGSAWFWELKEIGIRILTVIQSDASLLWTTVQETR